jgi:hypothetical protein
MSLIKCPVCTRLISELETSCPNCDFSLSEEIVLKIRADEKRESESKPGNKRIYTGMSSLISYR